MVRNKSACGLCKPHKKWKKNDTKEKAQFKQGVMEELSYSRNCDNKKEKAHWVSNEPMTVRQ